jgi:transcriptional regulator with XRE-family HTH domain
MADRLVISRVYLSELETGKRDPSFTFLMILADGLSITLSKLLVLLCYNRRLPQKGHRQSWRSRERARRMRKVAIECGLCLSGRMRLAA